MHARFFVAPTSTLAFSSETCVESTSRLAAIAVTEADVRAVVTTRAIRRPVIARHGVRLTDGVRHPVTVRQVVTPDLEAAFHEGHAL